LLGLQQPAYAGVQWNKSPLHAFLTSNLATLMPSPLGQEIAHVENQLMQLIHTTEDQFADLLRNWMPHQPGNRGTLTPVDPTAA